MRMGSLRTHLLLVALVCCQCQAGSSGLPDTCRPGAPSSSCLGGQWRNMGPAHAVLYASAACGDAGLFVWGGLAGVGSTSDCAYGCARGKLFQFASEAWAEIPTDGAPDSHVHGAAVWTGTEYLVWGGEVGDSTVPGGRYNPSTGKWSRMSIASQPSPRSYFAYAWTGSEFLVWGGWSNPGYGQEPTFFGDGGAYDPVTDSWRPVSTFGAPTPRAYPITVWAGHTWLVWGGIGGPAGQFETYYPNGASYDPTRDSWRLMQPSGAPNNPALGGAVWLDPQALFWGSSGSESTGSQAITPGLGGEYNPDSDSWSRIPSTNGPDMHSWPALLWTGRYVLALGRRSVKDASGNYVDVAHGRAFRAKDNTWMGMASGFNPRNGPTACWANGHAYLWGGSIGDGDQADGTVDIWTPPADAGP